MGASVSGFAGSDGAVRSGEIGDYDTQCWRLHCQPPGSPMKLHWSPRSPFVRKVMVAVHELGLVDRIMCVRTVAATTKPHAELMRDNPLSKIPTLVLDDGTVIYDSPVICEYLDGLSGAPKLHPTEPKARLVALRRQALGDGFLDLLVLL